MSPVAILYILKLGVVIYFMAIAWSMAASLRKIANRKD